MRFMLVLGLLIAQCVSSVAAPVRHHARRRYVFPGESRAMMPDFAAPARNGIDPNHPPVLEDQTPRYDDPSRQGGG